MNYKEDATYYDEVDGTITIIDNYLKYLKNNGIYDNSSIIIMSDHGYNIDNSSNGRQNPIFFIKGINESHKFKVSKNKFSYEDLNIIYENLINGKKDIDVFDNIDLDKTRYFLQYSSDNVNEMIELKTDDNAWNFNNMIPTGEVYKN